MSGPGPAAPPRGLIGFLDALRQGELVVGWAADPTDRQARPTIRLMRGVEVLAECEADVARDDGNPGFRLRAPQKLAPQDFLEGRVRVRALLPGRQASTTLAMTRRMREALEAEAGWDSTTEAPAAPPAAPPAEARPAQAVPAEAPGSQAGTAAPGVAEAGVAEAGAAARPAEPRPVRAVPVPPRP
ncbi:hypothetical protein HEQ75_17410, partial [Roseomonas sp. BU-1]|nr:hypothetical protein [Falsiroseomonas selenitidurans]